MKDLDGFFCSDLGKIFRVREKFNSLIILRFLAKVIAFFNEWFELIAFLIMN